MQAELLQWIDADGGAHDLAEGSDCPMDGIKGRMMPPLRRDLRSLPGQPGGQLAMVDHDVAVVDVLSVIRGADDVEVLDKVRALVDSLDPVGENEQPRFGKLRSTRGGATRELTCVYRQGMEGDESFVKSRGPTYWRMVLTFEASDPSAGPYWYDSAAIVETFTVGEPATWFPIFPLRLGSSEIFAEGTITNAGVRVWPRITVNGPGDHPVIRDLTTGRVIDLTCALDVGESLSIDTRPFHRGVTRNDGTSLNNCLSPVSDLVFPLVRGANAMRFEMTGATDDSSIVLSYTPRHLSA